MGMGVKSVGDLRYCCHASSSKEKGVLRDETGQIYNLHNHTFSSGRNSPVLKEVRAKMLAGERPSGCARCYSEEDVGIVSRRMGEKLDWPQVTEQKIKSMTQEDGSIDVTDFPLLYLDLRFGNKCNLSCRMCGPTESDRWYEAQSRIWETDRYQDGDRILQIYKDQSGKFKLKDNPYSWHDKPSFWEDIESHMASLQRIYLVGGEPLLIEGQFEFLQNCVEKGYASQITLEYNSNITALNEKILNLWKNFKKIEMGVSLDGIGPINDYIRYPSQWTHVSKQLERLDQVEGNYSIWWTSTVQIYNLLHLPEMMMWIIQQNYKRVNKSLVKKEILSPHPLYNPSFLSIQVFPPKSKEIIKNYFKEASDQAPSQIESLDFLSEDEKSRFLARYRKILEEYISVMMKQDLSALKEKFWHYTRRLDDIHGTSFKDVCPMTYDLMK